MNTLEKQTMLENSKETKPFTTLKDFNKAYNELRSAILHRNGIQEGQKARLNKCVVMYQMFNNNWFKVSFTKSDMRNRIKMYEGKSQFKLVALA